MPRFSRLYRKMPEGNHFRKLYQKRANGKIDGLKPAMRQSQAYTKQFGKAVFKASFEVN